MIIKKDAKVIERKGVKLQLRVIFLGIIFRSSETWLYGGLVDPCVLLAFPKINSVPIFNRLKLRLTKLVTWSIEKSTRVYSPEPGDSLGAEILDLKKLYATIASLAFFSSSAPEYVNVISEIL